LIEEDLTGSVQLSNCIEDPDELRELSSEHPRVTAERRALLASQKRRDGDLQSQIGTELGESLIDESILRDLELLGYTGGAED
jgi:hypothetical protein